MDIRGSCPLGFCDVLCNSKKRTTFQSTTFRKMTFCACNFPATRWWWSTKSRCDSEQTFPRLGPRVFLLVPAIKIHDQIEQAAKSWKEKNRREQDLDKYSCTCARLKALLKAVNDAWPDIITHLPQRTHELLPTRMRSL